MAADSNTPDLLEPCSHDSPQALLQDDSVQTSSPSLLASYCSISPVNADMTQATSTAEAACSAPSAARVPLGPEDSQANVSSVSPVFPVLPSSHLASHAERAPHQEQADSSGTAFPLYMHKHHLGDARDRGGESPRKTRRAVGAKRKLVVGGGQAVPHPCQSHGGPQHRKPPQRPSKGKGREVGRNLKFMSPQRAKKSRREIGPQCEEESVEEELDEEEGLEPDEEEPELDEEEEKELDEEEKEEEEQASSLRSPSYRLERHRELQPVKMKQLVGSCGTQMALIEGFCVPTLPVCLLQALLHVCKAPGSAGDGHWKAGMLSQAFLAPGKAEQSCCMQGAGRTCDWVKVQLCSARSWVGSSPC